LLENLIYLEITISVADFLRFVRLHHAPLNIWLSVILIPLLFRFFPRHWLLLFVQALELDLL